MGPNQFYITLQKNAGLDGRYTALGKVVAGADAVKDIKKGDPIRFIRITRVGQAARDFKTDDEAFGKLMGPTKK
jgi:cyclophilin family peptidyl-prolyl cis-trans isomerase